MAFVRPVFYLALFELKRLFFSPRGWLTLAVYSLVWGLLFYYIISHGAETLYSQEFSRMAHSVMGELGISELYNWPMPELTVFWMLAIYLFPFLCITFSADQTVSDRERGTLRYLLSRVSRQQILAGRFLGKVLLMALLSAVTFIAALVYGGLRDTSLLSSAVPQAGFLWLHLMLALIPYIAFMTMLNTLLRSARSVLLVTVLSMGLMTVLFSFLVWWQPWLEFVSYIQPGNDLMQLYAIPAKLLQSYWQPALQVIVFLSVASYISQRNAL
ncbi:ABC transporter permease [Neptunicella marina]|uniref:ABC transporter permease subunit n=1 Tax=Neptunicella marina TaxID=2125989 RepID=A0A8J6ILT5_9ALTE|nr:ABC transporter permease subunit [Neptunicella marina]MBC3764785.1 ABC transporter permease subunit [Neptunicella marina]